MGNERKMQHTTIFQNISNYNFIQNENFNYLYVYSYLCMSVYIPIDCSRSNGNVYTCIESIHAPPPFQERGRY